MWGMIGGSVACPVGMLRVQPEHAMPLKIAAPYSGGNTPVSRLWITATAEGERLARA